MHVAAFGLDADVTAAVAGLELEARAGSVVGALRLGAEAVVDVAAEGLNVEVRCRRAGKSKRRLPLTDSPSSSASRREREGGGDIARDGLESAAADGAELEPWRCRSR